MLIWCGVLFAMGVMAFLDSLFNYGEIFRQVNSVLFMLVSLGLLVRTTTKMRLRTFEQQTARIMALEEEVFALKNNAGMGARQTMSPAGLGV
jgi:predicted membrane-bound mannosyltransferase